MYGGRRAALSIGENCLNTRTDFSLPGLKSWALENSPLKHADIRALEAPPPFDAFTGITAMPPQNCKSDVPQNSLPSLRFEVPEAAQILRMSRAQLYNRIHEGSIKPQKDGTRTYITRVELERYVESCSISSPA